MLRAVGKAGDRIVGHARAQSETHEAPCCACSCAIWAACSANLSSRSDSSASQPCDEKRSALKCNA
eukprot:6677685-Prymnesium_polylepis.1